MGSDLKASGLSRTEVAYIMGHQSTESVDRYGNAKTARKGAMCPRADKEADMSHVRIDHKAPPGGPVSASVVEAVKSSGLARAALGDVLRRFTGGLSNDSVAPR